MALGQEGRQESVVCEHAWTAHSHVNRLTRVTSLGQPSSSSAIRAAASAHSHVRLGSRFRLVKRDQELTQTHATNGAHLSSSQRNMATSYCVRFICPKSSRPDETDTHSSLSTPS